ncbi:MAG: hypothetical protein ACTSP3_07310 [Candidatus Heimdallarchaeaceae archaeon]
MDGELIENLTFSQLQSLLSQIGQHGSIRRCIAIFDHPLKQERYITHYSFFRERHASFFRMP